MNFHEVTDTFLQVAQQYRQDMGVAFKYINDQKLSFRMVGEGRVLDVRDFLPLVAIMGVQGSTPEKRADDVRNKIDELTKAFTDEDVTQRNKYLDKMFDLVDTFDPATVDMHNPVEVGKLLQCMLMDQCTGEKKKENPEYYNNRYSTQQQKAVVDAKLRFLTAASEHVNKNLLDNKLDIPSIASLPKYAKHIAANIHGVRLDFAKIRRDQAVAAMENPAATNTYDLPVLDEMIPFARKGIQDVKKYNKEQENLMFNYYAFVMDEHILQLQNENMEGFKDARMNLSTDTLYIDGMPYTDFVKEHFPKAKTTDVFTGKLLPTILLNGNHKMDVVHAYRDANGQMQYEAKTLRPTVTPEQEELYMQQFSWFRRTFFNWWPFNIETLQEKIDRISNDPAAEDRRANICNDAKEKIETSLARIEEEALQKKREEELANAKRNAVNKEKERFDNSVSKWDEKSVIGVLGKMAKGSYNDIGRAIFSFTGEARYTNAANALAKQVLYSQLYMERADNNGEMGEVEKTLMGDGQPETIQKNIDACVKKYAEDPALRELFYSKVADERGELDGEKFKDLITSGGSQLIAREYTKIQGKSQEGKEPPMQVGAKENEIQKEEHLRSMG